MYENQEGVSSAVHHITGSEEPEISGNIKVYQQVVMNITNIICTIEIFLHKRNTQVYK